ncbi:FlgO family outer membrane protein, partial [Arthrospira platensis SPKY2]
YESAQQHQFQSVNREAAERLVGAPATLARADAPVLIATIVNVNDLRRTAPLGRVLSENYTTALVQQGFNVKEVRLRGDLFVQEGTGQLMLSRELKDIAREHSAY